MAKLKELVINAVEGIVIRGERKREDGYHASSAGKCIRSVVVNRYVSEPIHDFSTETKSIFHIGHSIDRFFKDSFERTVREGNVRMLAPFQTISFGSRNFDGIFGEGDVTLLDFDTKTIHWIDCKSCGHDQFYNKKSRGASLMNMLQVGTYAGSKQVQQLLQSLGWSNIKGWLVYIDKENYNHVTQMADTSSIENARAYWSIVEKVDAIYRETGALPMASPEEDWECGYCHLWPGLPQNIEWKNKTAVKNARSQLRYINRELCESSGDVVFKNAIGGELARGENNILGSTEGSSVSDVSNTKP